MQIKSSIASKILLPVTAAMVVCLAMCFTFNAPNSTVHAQDADEVRPKIDLQFQMLRQQTVPGNFYRSKVPGGWIVAVTPLNDRQSVEMVFVPDAEHSWDGKSLK